MKFRVAMGGANLEQLKLKIKISESGVRGEQGARRRDCDSENQTQTIKMKTGSWQILKVLTLSAAACVLMSCSTPNGAQSTATTRTPLPPIQGARVASETPAAAAPGEWTGGLIRLSKRMPADVSVGEEFMYELTPAAANSAGNVIVTDRVPAGAAYVRSEPTAQVQGDRLLWNLGDLDAGQSVPIKVWLKAERVGQLTSCAAVAAEPRICSVTTVGKPGLALTKTGPALIRLGDDVSYMITVSNNGSAIAKNVVVTDQVPEGLRDESGKSELVFNVGDLAPNQSKQFPVTLKSTDKRGQVTNVAVAKSSNAGEVKAEAATTMALVSLKITKEGPERQLVGKAASYKIVVTNDGDVDMNDLKVTDVAPEQCSILAADGATVTGNTAVWNLPALEKGGQKSYEVQLTSRVPGTVANVATLDTAKGIKFNAQASTEWIGVTGVLVELVDNPDPIQIGETTTYTIKVTNQGSTRDIQDMNLKAIFRDEIDPLTPSSGGTIAGKTVTWPTVASIPPKQSATFTVIGKGLKAGDHRLEIQVTTKGRTNPISSFESTTVY
jgi:uncharacterized repeat protein (TIGR01451 family)